MTIKFKQIGLDYRHNAFLTHCGKELNRTNGSALKACVLYAQILWNHRTKQVAVVNENLCRRKNVCLSELPPAESLEHEDDADGGHEHLYEVDAITLAVISKLKKLKFGASERLVALRSVWLTYSLVECAEGAWRFGEINERGGLDELDLSPLAFKLDEVVDGDKIALQMLRDLASPGDKQPQGKILSDMERYFSNRAVPTQEKQLQAATIRTSWPAYDEEVQGITRLFARDAHNALVFKGQSPVEEAFQGKSH